MAAKTNWILLFSFAVLLLPALPVAAAKCDIRKPAFMVNGENQWQDLTATEVFNKYDKVPLSKGRKMNREGVHLRTLVEPFSQQGMLTIHTCGKKTLSLNITDLFSEDREKSDYVLILAPKGFFKVVSEDGANNVIKKISRLTLEVTQ